MLGKHRKDSLSHFSTRVANDLAARIATGEFANRLPSERALAAEYGVGYATIRRGMTLLRERGVVITCPGRGFFVASRPYLDLLD
jgi:DNA-binding GntR family transcriptional regulator